jgi:Ran GTPase-activating protein (RanGAP) involved in mRNA processing and transport
MGIASDIEEDSQAMSISLQSIQEERDLAQAKDKVQWNDISNILEELKEKNNRMNPYDEEEVYFSFSSYPLSLRTTLSLTKGLLGKQGGNILGQFLKKTKNLQELCLTEIDDSEGFEGLIEGLKENETLQNFELNRMVLSFKEFKELSKSLKGKRELIKLEFNSISPRDKGAYFDLLSSFLHIPMQEEEGEEWGIRKQNEEPTSKHFLPNLKYLSFSNCKLKKRAAPYLKYFIRNSSNLQELHLKENYLGKCWIREINPALESSQIRILNLQANKIGSKGCKWLLQALPNTHITSLNLANNNIGNKGLKLLPQALKLSRNLTRLDLSNNKLNDKATPYISQALKETSSLQFLSLARNKIEDAGATYIASNLDGYQTLNLLDLSGKEIGNAGFISFCLNIHKNHQIQHIILTNTDYFSCPLSCLEDNTIPVPSLWQSALRAFLTQYPVLVASSSI